MLLDSIDLNNYVLTTKALKNIPVRLACSRQVCKMYAPQNKHNPVGVEYTFKDVDYLACLQVQLIPTAGKPYSFTISIKR